MIRLKKDPVLRNSNKIYFDEISKQSDVWVQADFLRLNENIVKLEKRLRLFRSTLEITKQELQCRGLLDYDGCD